MQDNNKGKPCPVDGRLCQEGYCRDCGVHYMAVMNRIRGRVQEVSEDKLIPWSQVKQEYDL